MLNRIRRARAHELRRARELPALQHIERVVGDARRFLGNDVEVEERAAAVVVRDRLHARDERADVAALRDVPAEPEIDHELVQHARGVQARPVLVERRFGGEGEAGQGGHDDVVRQCRGVGVFLLKEGEEREELEEGTWPAVVEDDGRGVGRGAEERNEMDSESAAVKRVLDWEGVVRERVDVLLVRTPVGPFSSITDSSPLGLTSQNHPPTAPWPRSAICV